MVRHHGSSRRFFSLAAAGLLGAALLIAPAPTASAACPDVEVVFARGRLEPPGVGAVGDAFVNALRSMVSVPVGVYGVNWPADIDIVSGANDMSAHVQSMAASCPNTRMVLGGYSLGASVADLATRARLSPNAAAHVAAVALFGNAARRFGPALAGKTIDQCADGDPVCGRGTNWPSHLQPSYLGSGLVEQAASFSAGRL